MAVASWGARECQGLGDKKGEYCWSNETRERLCRNKQDRVHGRVYKGVGLAQGFPGLAEPHTGVGEAPADLNDVDRRVNQVNLRH